MKIKIIIITLFCLSNIQAFVQKAEAAKKISGSKKATSQAETGCTSEQGQCSSNGFSTMINNILGPGFCPQCAQSIQYSDTGCRDSYGNWFKGTCLAEIWNIYSKLTGKSVKYLQCYQPLNVPAGSSISSGYYCPTN